MVKSRASTLLLLGLLALPLPAQGGEALERLVPFPAEVPLGLPAELPAPQDNPFTEASFALGRKLFFDPILSSDRSVACASCHRPEHGFSSPEAFPKGVGDRRALRHAPTLYNRAFGHSQRWDGRTPTLEEQVLLPIEDPNEMDLRVEDALGRLRGSEAYRREFAAVFPDGLGRRNLARVLATFVRGITLGDSPVDRFLQGEVGALTREELAGMWVYESKGGCWRCHPRPNYTDEGFHNTGIGARDGVAEPGRQAVTGDDADRGRFKVPTLRGLARTGPYMHDGSIETLAEVVEFYRRGGNDNADRSPLLRPLELSDADARNLVSFLRALSRTAGE